MIGLKRGMLVLAGTALFLMVTAFQPQLSLNDSTVHHPVQIPSGGFLSHVVSRSHWMTPKAAIAQVPNFRAIAQRVHEQLPDLAREDHYVHMETGEVDPSNTLAYRLLQYHSGVKFRPLPSRFDWKLTLADYLGVNEWMDEERYPSRFLESNPYSSDVAVIQALNRQQREQLLDVLLATLAP